MQIQSAREWFVNEEAGACLLHRRALKVDALGPMSLSPRGKKIVWLSLLCLVLVESTAAVGLLIGVPVMIEDYVAPSRTMALTSLPFLLFLGTLVWRRSSMATCVVVALLASLLAGQCIQNAVWALREGDVPPFFTLLPELFGNVLAVFTAGVIGLAELFKALVRWKFERPRRSDEVGPDA